MAALRHGLGLGSSLTTLGSLSAQPLQIRAVVGRPGRRLRHRRLLVAAKGRPFADFLQFEERGSGDVAPPPPAKIGSGKAEDLVDRASSLLEEARAALQSVREREPADSRQRRSGPGLDSRTTGTASSSDGGSIGGGGASASTSRGLTAFVWESDLDAEEEEGGWGGARGGTATAMRDYGEPPVGATADWGADASSGSGSGGGGGGGGGGWSQAGLDSWFGDKVETGPLQLRKTLKPMSASSVAVLERPEGVQTLEFAAPDAPKSEAPSIFPAAIELLFQPSEIEVAAAAATEVPAAAEAEAAEPAVAPEGNWERRSGEEVGAHGYWYRWTEVRGCDETGAVQWYEKWWEVSDWRGMKEMGAEKWGCNARGDAWRETWREAIVFDEANQQPLVERSAHKWAKNVAGNEWEEKWGEQYWSAGRAEKWADKWARDGRDVWHEKWGESYDGAGGCVKYTDKWAERGHLDGSKEEWGDKWEENFKDGRGTKTGETWSVGGGGERYNRWWGENHQGDGFVQRFGNSSTGEHWDHTEQMDTYYNPIPHFGYDLALAHSPILRGVPMLPRDRDLESSGLNSVV